MLTTREAGSDLLASRCMALAAQVRPPSNLYNYVMLKYRYVTAITSVSRIFTNHHIGRQRPRSSLPHKHRIWQDR
jgi:hypothetical protein